MPGVAGAWRAGNTYCGPKSRRDFHRGDVAAFPEAVTSRARFNLPPTSLHLPPRYLLSSNAFPPRAVDFAFANRREREAMRTIAREKEEKWMLLARRDEESRFSSKERRNSKIHRRRMRAVSPSQQGKFLLPRSLSFAFRFEKVPNRTFFNATVSLISQYFVFAARSPSLSLALPSLLYDPEAIVQKDTFAAIPLTSLAFLCHCTTLQRYALVERLKRPRRREEAKREKGN